MCLREQALKTEVQLKMVNAIMKTCIMKDHYRESVGICCG